MSTPAIDIVPLASVRDPARLGPELDAIMFEASATKSFESERVRAEFRERWLGRYLAHDPGEAFLAIAADGTLAGYLVGSLDDPAQNSRFDDIGYFKEIAALTRRYPAHLHVNLAPAFRSAGVGARLVEAFARHAKAAGTPGVHVVTGEGMRNVSFYIRQGFEQIGSVAPNGRTLVVLGRLL